MKNKHCLACILLLLPLFLFAQTKTITGVVKDTQGEPLIGVTVQVQGHETEGVVTDFDGVYRIKTSAEDKYLVFSYIGMVKQRVKIDRNVKSLNVTMQEDQMNLDEVVVIGYGAVKKKELTGAVAQVKGDELTEIVTADLGAALQGKVSGVSIVASSGAPGAASEILIRGVTSINGANTPLYVVDGVPQEGDPRISTNEIQTIDVLKDAASCAIYGTRGAAGVILITTKQGEAGKLKIAVDASFGIRDITSGTPLMNTAEQAYFDFVKFRNNDGSLDDKVNIDMIRNPYYIQNDTDLLSHAIVSNANTQNYSVNISGGAKNATYNVVAGYYDEKGIIINSGFKRFNARANMSYNNKKWRVNSSLALNLEDKDEAPGSIITYTLSYAPHMPELKPGNTDDVETPRDGNWSRTNWILESFNTTNNLKGTRANANINVSYDILKGLTASARMGANIYNNIRHKFKPPQNVYDVSSGELISTEKDSYAENSAARNFSLTFDTSLNYKRKFGDHQVGATAVFSLEEYNFDGFSAKRFGVVNSSVESMNGATGDQIVHSNAAYKTKLIGAIGRVQYDWKGRYLISANIRRDGSSKFSKDNRWGTFPSVSAAWNVSDEPFWSKAEDVVNNFKVRASYGTTGNQSFGAYTYSPTITNGFDYVFGDDASSGQGYGSAQYSFANADVKWETSEQVNVGLDLSFLQNKITLTAEYYQTSKRDMLFPVTLPTSTGTNQRVVLNVGNMTNKGVELALGYREQIGKVKLGINGTFSTNENRVSGFDGLNGIVMASDGVLIWGANAQSQCTGIAEGYPAGGFFLYKTDGIINTASKLADYQKINPGAKMGDLIYVDSNKDGTISEADRRYSGSGLPEYEIGFNVNLGWKGIDFSMNWYSAIGHELINGSKAMAYAYGRHKDLLYAWSEANPLSNIPAYRGDIKAHENYHAHTDLWLEDGTYLRLKSATLGYTLPSDIMKKAGISQLRVFVSAQNPLTFTKYKGYDPEIGGAITSRGLDRGNYPISSLYMIGLNLNF